MVIAVFDIAFTSSGQLWKKGVFFSYIGITPATIFLFPQGGGGLSVTLILVAIDSILGELKNGVDRFFQIWQYTLQQEIRE